jgi:hypothetical protein
MTLKVYNSDPYFDDFSEDKKFYRILYRPGVAVQARELTQMQTIVNEQVARFGRSIFEEGMMVIPGGGTVDLEYGFIKLNDLSPSETDVAEYLNSFVGTIITGQTTGVKARVVNATAATLTDPLTLFVKYTNSGTDKSTQRFAAGEVVLSDAEEAYEAVIQSGENKVGFGSAVSVAKGVYYISDMFVLNEEQTIILDKYSNNPTYKVGFFVDQVVVTSQTDPSLNDNANGSPNYAAPGAHRYSINLLLQKRALVDESTENFVQIMQVEGGVIRARARQGNYSVFEETMARRTFDESGNYTVKAFNFEAREHLKTPTNRGIYSAEDGGSEAKLAIGMEAGKAYVRGFEIETLSTTYIPIDKSRDFASDNNVAIPFNLGAYINVKRLHGVPNITTFPVVSLRDTAVVSDGSAAGSEIGTARVRAVEHFTGTLGSSTTVYRFFLFDIKMASGQTFSDIRSVYVPGTPPTTADLVLENTQAVLQDTSTNNLLVRMPYSTIKTVRGSGGSIDTNYSVRRVYSGSLLNGTTQITAGIDEQFITPYSSRDFLMVIASTGEVVNLSAPRSGDARVELTGTPSGKNLIIRLDDLGFETESYVLIATVYKQEASEKQKTLVSNYAHNINSPNTTPGNYDILGKADIFELKAVYMSTDMNTAATTSSQNVTARYTLDNGQRDNFYDIGRIQLKSGQPAPIGRLLVVFDYFIHGAGDYFSVDSYTGQVSYDRIPTYQSRFESFALRDVLDFRPRVRDDGESFVNDSGNNITGASLVEIPRIGDNVRTDFDFYLARIDKIYLDPKGSFGVVKGVSSLTPNVPKDPDDAMVLYELTVLPYTFGPQDVIPKLIDNRRYTMRDIGRIDQRVKNLEYYTSLSLLEKETADLQILDVNNVDRFKNGFIVDPFYGHNIGNPGDPDYHISIDATRGEARPQFYEDAVRLEYNSGASSNIVKTGDALTLPYTHQSFINQPVASKEEFVNPFDVVRFVGKIDLSPSSDDWKDTESRPELIVDNQGLFDVVNTLFDEDGILGTVWNEWQTQWTGTSITNDVSSTRSGNIRTNVTNVIETTQSNQARSGIRTSVSPDTIQTSFGNRVVDVRMIPFIRSRRIKFKATALKPNTRIYAFFESIDVSDFCIPLTSFTRFSDAPTDPEPNTSAVRHPDLTEDDILNEVNALFTNDAGELVGEFYIPNTDSIKFRTGDRTFRLTDDANNTFQGTTCSGQVVYSASGITESTQEVSLRSPTIQQDTLDPQTRVITNSRLIDTLVSTSVIPQPDPLAQTFLVDQPGGVMITKVDLYFSQKDQNLPVIVQIRSVDNGYPTTIVLPFAEVIKPASEVVVSDDATAATTFTFPVPVYLNQGREYSIVVLANTQEYKMWIAELGENEIGTTNRISKQPSTGVLFKSQNSSTWTADQMQDMKYHLYRAKFNTNVVGTLVLNNANIPLRKLQPNPIYTTASNNTIRVFHKNHAMLVNSKVAITGVSGADVNGIPTEQLNATHTISAVEQDWYSIVISTNATSTGNSGGTLIYATENKTINVLQPNLSIVQFPDTRTDWAVRLTTSQSLAGSESAFTLDNALNYKPVVLNDNYLTDRPYMIASKLNEDDKLGGSKSFWLRGTFTTDSDNVSPMIDMERMTAICVNNRVDNPQSVGSGQSGKNEVVNYVSEIAPTGASALCRYITRKITLDQDATAIKTIFAANRPDGSTIEVYYKIQSSGSDQKFEELPWIQATSQVVPLTTEDTRQFKDYEYLDEGLTAFTSVAIKIVIKSQNSSKVPRIRDLRVIALAT